VIHQVQAGISRRDCLRDRVLSHFFFLLSNETCDKIIEAAFLFEHIKDKIKTKKSHSQLKLLLPLRELSKINKF
jgi:hypothetical protein